MPCSSTMNCKVLCSSTKCGVIILYLSIRQFIIKTKGMIMITFAMISELCERMDIIILELARCIG